MTRRPQLTFNRERFLLVDPAGAERTATIGQEPGSIPAGEQEARIRAELKQPVCDGPSILRDFLAVLDARAVPYCIVGDTGSLPEIPRNDIDIVCAGSAQATVRAAIEDLARRHGGELAQVLRHESEARYHVLFFPREHGTSIYLKLDVCSDYVVEGRLLLSAEWLLAERRQSETADRSMSFYVCAPEREFAYYLLKKIAKGSADGAALRHLSRLFTIEPDKCRAVLDRFWAKDDASRIEHAIVGETWSTIGERIGELRRRLRTRLPPASVRLWAAEFARRLERLVRPTGFVVAVLGPDGSGKSTLLNTLSARLLPLNRNLLSFHLAPPIWRKKTGGTVTDPHGKQPRGVLASVAKLFYLVAVYNAGWLASVGWPRRRSTMIFFDRYFHDIAADPLRYRNSAPARIVRALGRLIPSPDLFLILDVDPAVARARKAEVSPAESERQFHSYRELCATLPRAHLIDANRAPEAVADACERLVVHAMAKRLKERERHAAP